MFVLPRTRAPASETRWTAVAVYGGRVALEDPRSGGGRDALGAEDVLDGDRACPRSASPPAAGAAGLGAPQVGAEVVACGGLGVGVEVLAGVEVARLDPAQRLGRGQLRQLASRLRASELGRRRRRDRARARAPARAAGSARGSSARSTFSSSTTCVVGSTPSRSSAEIRSTWSRIARELARHPLDLLVARARSRDELRDVEDLLALDHAGDSRQRGRAGGRTPACSQLARRASPRASSRRW